MQIKIFNLLAPSCPSPTKYAPWLQVQGQNEGHPSYIHIYTTPIPIVIAISCNSFTTHIIISLDNTTITRSEGCGQELAHSSATNRNFNTRIFEGRHRQTLTLTIVPMARLVPSMNFFHLEVTAERPSVGLMEYRPWTTRLWLPMTRAISPL